PDRLVLERPRPRATRGRTRGRSGCILVEARGSRATPGAPDRPLRRDSMVKRILLVEDSPIIQAAAVHALTSAGYEVSARSTFDELLANGVDGYDLILMDVQMPELFGDDVAMVLRSERGIT